MLWRTLASSMLWNWNNLSWKVLIIVYWVQGSLCRMILMFISWIFLQRQSGKIQYLSSILKLCKVLLSEFTCIFSEMRLLGATKRLMIICPLLMPKRFWCFLLTKSFQIISQRYFFLLLESLCCSLASNQHNVHLLLLLMMVPVFAPSPLLPVSFIWKRKVEWGQKLMFFNSSSYIGLHFFPVVFYAKWFWQYMQ